MQCTYWCENSLKMTTRNLRILWFLPDMANGINPVVCEYLTTGHNCVGTICHWTHIFSWNKSNVAIGVTLIQLGFILIQLGYFFFSTCYVEHDQTILESIHKWCTPKKTDMDLNKIPLIVEFVPSERPPSKPSVYTRWAPTSYKWSYNPYNCL